MYEIFIDGPTREAIQKKVRQAMFNIAEPKKTRISIGIVSEFDTTSDLKIPFGFEVCFKYIYYRPEPSEPERLMRMLILVHEDKSKPIPRDVLAKFLPLFGFQQKENIKVIKDQEQDKGTIGAIQILSGMELDLLLTYRKTQMM